MATPIFLFRTLTILLSIIAVIAVILIGTCLDVIVTGYAE
jgi:hypothetical protein